MSKDSHFTGQPVYSQVLKLLDREKILQISRETAGSEAYVKRFDGYQHLVVMHRLIMNNLWKLEIILRKKKICDFKRA